MTRYALIALLVCDFLTDTAGAQERDELAVPVVSSVEGQPLAANVTRLMQALGYLGRPFPEAVTEKLIQKTVSADVLALQKVLDREVFCVVSINPEVRVKVLRGPSKPVVQQGGYTPVVVKVINRGAVTRRLNITSPQAGPVYSGTSLAILKRQAQTELKSETTNEITGSRFLSLAMFQDAPMTRNLSGLEVEYAIALIYSADSGKREATIGFDVGEGTQDIGFRAEVPVLFDFLPAKSVKLSIRDADGSPTIARLIFRDKAGHVYPSQAKRLSPDFFFQPQIYRGDGDTVTLPSGTFTVQYSRGPEYRVQRQDLLVHKDRPTTLVLRLQRWVEPSAYGFYSGDHHIHGAGCSHYENPTRGVTPEAMFRQVKGEGLNVGCVLTWGPCFDFQRQFFSPLASTVSEPQTILKYDLEISGFGSAALGHVCLLNLTDQTYPGSAGTKTAGWPTWTVPVMRWAKEQGAVTGYPHSAMHVDAETAALRILKQGDRNDDQQLSQEEGHAVLLPFEFDTIDVTDDTFVSRQELQSALSDASDQLPNLAIPAMTGAGAMEIFVSAVEGVCDFISAMDTARVSEWNTWYHLMNCGFPIKLSGETDFPCMSSRRVGQGRVYVQLGTTKAISFSQWCQAIALGRSYVSDGYAHALKFEVSGVAPGFADVKLSNPGKVNVSATVCFAEKTPMGVAYGNQLPPAGPRMIGDTVNLHLNRSTDHVTGGMRKVELIVNGLAVASRDVMADGNPHELTFDVSVSQSSWIALRHFPQLHTNPVNVEVAGYPIRASIESARWCQESVQLLWENRNKYIGESEREEAWQSYQDAIAVYKTRAEEAEQREKRSETAKLSRNQ